MTLTFAMAVWEKGSIAESSLEVQIAMGLCPPLKIWLFLLYFSLQFLIQDWSVWYTLLILAHLVWDRGLNSLQPALAS